MTSKQRPKSEAVSTAPVVWQSVSGYEDILYEKAAGEALAKISINRPEVRNAFRPQTVFEMSRAFADARDDSSVGVVILTGAGDEAFCSGGDQRVRGAGGYVGQDGVARLNVLDLQRQIRTLPKPVVAMVKGYAIGGGHVLHVVCDLTIAADNARFGQTGPKVGSFDGGYGASYMARIVGQKKAREIWFLCRQYSAHEALDMGLVNKVVPVAKLEEEGVAWAKEILQRSPLAIRCLKAAFNAELDGQSGIQELAGNRWLVSVIQDLRKVLKLTRLLSLSIDGRLEQSLIEHRVILDAIKAGDAVAAQTAMHDHILSVRRALVRSISQHEVPA